ncbi:hypothetical protein GCM10023083_59950 [Streptomyces phyllanthi]
MLSYAVVVADAGEAAAVGRTSPASTAEVARARGLQRRICVAGIGGSVRSTRVEWATNGQEGDMDM